MKVAEHCPAQRAQRAHSARQARQARQSQYFIAPQHYFLAYPCSASLSFCLCPRSCLPPRGGPLLALSAAGPRGSAKTALDFVCFQAGRAAKHPQRLQRALTAHIRIAIPPPVLRTYHLPTSTCLPTCTPCTPYTYYSTPTGAPRTSPWDAPPPPPLLLLLQRRKISPR